MKIEELTLQQKIGQLFVTGFPGDFPSAEFLNIIKKYSIGNVILFTHNVKDKEQLANLSKYLHKEIFKNTAIVPFISMDEEGGVVSRLPSECAIMPSAMALGKIQDKNLLYNAAKITGMQLKNLGINLNLAPVLDINSNKNNPVIGVRSYGNDTFTVETCARAVMNGYLDSGIICSGKHFPGHGDTSEDSHTSLPYINLSLEELEKREIAPFTALMEEGLPAITIAHLLVSCLEEKRIPCTMSKQVVEGYVRDKLHFNGLVISDCMEMDAINKYYDMEDGVIAAINAGVDLIFISHSIKKVETSIAEIYKALEDGRLKLERINQAVTRILEAKEKVKNTDHIQPHLVGTNDQIDFMNQLLKKTIKPYGKEEKFCLGTKPIFLGPYPSRMTQASSNIDRHKCFANIMQSSFGGDALNFSINPNEDEIDKIISGINDNTSVVLATLNGHLYPGQKNLIRKVKKLQLPAAFVALRNPFDLDFVEDGYFRICLYEYSERTIKILIDNFFK